jgi:hypothetical protein
VNPHLAVARVGPIPARPRLIGSFCFRRGPSARAPVRSAPAADEQQKRGIASISLLLAVPYVAGWGEDGALEAVTEFAKTIDELARRIENALAEAADQHAVAA